jgi:hypothetical protein
MWPIPLLTGDCVVIIFSQKNITGILLQKNTVLNNYTVAGYENYALKNEMSCALIFNITEYILFIKNFLKKYNQYNAFIGFIIADTFLEYEYKTMPTHTITNESLGITHASMSTTGYQCAYTNTNGQAVFYVYRVQKAILLQYMLIGLHIPLNLITIMPQHLCLLEAYKMLKGPAFRQTEFALAMENNENNIMKCIPSDLLHTKITLPTFLTTENDKEKITSAYGLFRSQGFPL